MVVSGGGLTLPGDCRFCKQSNRRLFDFVLNEEKEKEIIVYICTGTAPADLADLRSRLVR